MGKTTNFEKMNKKTDSMIGDILSQMSDISKDPVKEFGLDDLINNASDEMRKNIVDKAPESADGGYYKRGWKTVRNFQKSSKIYSTSSYSDAGKRYRPMNLMWLLENGHMTLDHGFTTPQPHIMPAYNKSLKNLTKNAKLAMDKRIAKISK